MGLEDIRNFCIIAHVDHGKSTLADRILQHLGAVDDRKFRDQMLDDMELERERGITIKARAVRLEDPQAPRPVQLNLIDTPGHVDFSYEVSRSLSACEGAVLLVDAVQGVQAQTVANAYLAMEQGLDLVPVVNKIDLSHARVEETIREMHATLDIDPESVIAVSAKTGENVPAVLQAIRERIRSPEGQPEAPLRALVFDSTFDDYRGVVLYLRVFDGVLRAGDKVRLQHGGRTYEVAQVGTFRPDMRPEGRLSAGEVGYCIAGIRNMREVQVGDTLGLWDKPVEPLPGYRQPQPMVFCGLYPADDHEVTALRQALERLALNDPSFTFEPETSDALGFGFRCGFLGLLHMEIIQERLERESHLDLVQTAPNVTYEVLMRNGEVVRVANPSRIPDGAGLQELREPFVRADLILPSEAIGPVMRLTEERRGVYRSTEYLGPDRVVLEYDLPLAEVLYDFYDRLKSITRGYGAMDYEFIGFRPGDLVRLDVLVSGERVDAMSSIVHRDEAHARGKRICRQLIEEILRQQFSVPVQAAAGGRIVARETLRALGKNVTAKCYGGDVTRKRKLLERQKEGKRRMRSVASIEIPQSAFLSILNVREPHPTRGRAS